MLKTTLLIVFLAVASAAFIVFLTLYLTKKCPQQARDELNYVVYYGEVNGRILMLGLDYKNKLFQSYTIGFNTIGVSVSTITNDTFTATLDFGGGDVSKTEFRHGQDVNSASAVMYQGAPNQTTVLLNAVTIPNVAQNLQFAAQIA